MQNIKLVNNSQHHAPPHPLPYPSSNLSIYHLHRSAPVNDAFPALDVFVVRVWKGGDNLVERDKKCHLFRGTLEPISRADQPPILPDTSSSHSLCSLNKLKWNLNLSIFDIVFCSCSMFSAQDKIDNKIHHLTDI